MKLVDEQFHERAQRSNSQEERDRLQREYHGLSIHIERDDAFIRNGLCWWKQKGIDKAAILNAGTSHQDRIVKKLPPDVRFIQIDTLAT